MIQSTLSRMRRSKMPSLRSNAESDATLAAGASTDEYHDPSTARTTIRLAAVALVLFFVWAAVAPIHEIATGMGEILPTGFVQDVQHLEGGIVDEILAIEGQQVEKGAPLLKINDLAVRAELTKAKARAEAIRLEILRQLPVTTQNTSVFEGELQLRGIIDSQRQANESEDTYRRAQLDVINAEIATKQAAIENLQQRNAKIGEELGILTRQLSDYEQAYKSGAISRRERDTVARDKIGLESNLIQIAGQLTSTQSSLLESQARLREVSAGFQQVAQAAIADLEIQRAEALEVVAQLSDRLERTIIRAPEAGTVQQVFARNAGQVLAPGSPAAQIVPTGRNLFAEIKIPADQIGFISTGMQANIKILTYDYARFGGMTGKITDISASSFKRDDGGEPYYRVRLALENEFVGEPDAGHRISPGMSIVADVVLGQKTVLGYLLKPLRALSDRAMSEQ